MQRIQIWIYIFLIAAVGAPVVMSDANDMTTYTINFTGSPTFPKAGSFTYDPDTQTFSSFVVIWDGINFDLTASANAPVLSATPPPCLGSAKGGAASFALLSGACAPAQGNFTTLWFAHLQPSPQLEFTTGDGTSYIKILGTASPVFVNDVGGGDWSLTKTTAVHKITLSPTSLNFSRNVVGTSSAQQTIMVRNAGTVAEHISSVTSSGLYSRTNNCPATLPAKATCTVVVQFAPTAVGQVNGAIQVTASVIPQPPLVSLSGVGIAPLTFSSASLSFGTVAVATTSGAQSVTLTNNLSHAVSLSSVATSADFSQVNNCSSSLGPGASCQFAVTFHPTVSRLVSGALTIGTSASPGTQPLGLSGTGSGPVASNLVLSPATLSFGKQEAGTTSAAKNVTLTNTSATSSLTIGAVSTTSNYVAGGTCSGKMIPAGGSCVISVAFHPTANFAPVAYPGAVTIVDSDGTSPQAVGLSGIGNAPIASSLGSLNFGTVLSGHNSPTQSVTLTNKHTTAETLSIVSSLEYQLTNNGCSGPVPPAGQCSFQIAFSPHFLGIIKGAATIRASSGGFLNSQVVSLSGCSSNSTLLPTMLNFGIESVGLTSPPLRATVHAQSPITFTSVSVTGKNAGDFSISSNTCGSGLGGTASCNVIVTFTPTVAGTRSGILNVSDSGGCSPQQVNLVGMGR